MTKINLPLTECNRIGTGNIFNLIMRMTVGIIFSLSELFENVRYRDILYRGLPGKGLYMYIYLIISQKSLFQNSIQFCETHSLEQLTSRKSRAYGGAISVYLDQPFLYICIYGLCLNGTESEEIVFCRMMLICDKKSRL